MKVAITLFYIIAAVTAVFGQQTVGLFQNDSDAHPGYVLFAPIYSDTTYLINECGRVSHKWSSGFGPGAGVELLSNGELIRGCEYQGGTVFSGGGVGGRIESLNASSSVNWSFNYSSDLVRHHHDFEMMPNGNVLMIAWELKSELESIESGRNPLEVNALGMWPEHIIEYNPGLGVVTWEWHAWDHLIQDLDASKANYGVVSEHPELININYLSSDAADWQHFNSIDYNADLDQILVSSPNFNEIYIIDHSTTTLEAMGHTGGNSGKGGDILWRWGNSEAYAGSQERQFFFQHDASWIANENPDAGKIIVFNNGNGRTPIAFSSVEIIEPEIDGAGNYIIGGNGTFLPEQSQIIYSGTGPTDFYSPIISSANQLANGNTFINEGNKGRFFEVDQNGSLLWEYVNPAVQDSLLEQEEAIPGNTFIKFNAVFRARKLETSDPGLANLVLQDLGELEVNPYPTTCIVGLEELSNQKIEVFPNPNNKGILFVNSEAYNSVEFIDQTGREVLKMDIVNQSIDISTLNPGVYFVRMYATELEQGDFVKLIVN